MIKDFAIRVSNLGNIQERIQSDKLKLDDKKNNKFFQRMQI